MAYLCLGIGPTKKQQAFIYVKIHILRVHFLGTSLRVQGTKLPYKMRKTGPWYGSQQGYRDKNFRTKCGKQASGTEVCRCTRHETSV